MIATMLQGIRDAFVRARDLPELAPLHVNEDGWLEGEGVVHVPSHRSWFYRRLSTPTGDPRAIVAHASATEPGTAIVMARRRTRPRTAGDRAASWHVSIEPHGPTPIVQQASFEVGCWHAIGRIKRVGPANRTAAGIELIGWERGPWPEPQVLTAARVWRALAQSYGIPRRFAMIQHSKIDPQRRTDPGKPWMRAGAKRVLAYAYAP